MSYKKINSFSDVKNQYIFHKRNNAYYLCYCLEENGEIFILNNHSYSMPTSSILREFHKKYHRGSKIEFVYVDNRPILSNFYSFDFDFEVGKTYYFYKKHLPYMTSVPIIGTIKSISVEKIILTNKKKIFISDISHGSLLIKEKHVPLSENQLSLIGINDDDSLLYFKNLTGPQYTDIITKKQIDIKKIKELYTFENEQSLIFHRDPLISFGFLSNKKWIEKGDVIPNNDYIQNNTSNITLNGQVIPLFHFRLTPYHNILCNSYFKNYVRNCRLTIAKTGDLNWSDYGCCDPIKSKGNISIFIPDIYLEKTKIKHNFAFAYLEEIQKMIGDKKAFNWKYDISNVYTSTSLFSKKGIYVNINVSQKRSYFFLILVRFLWYSGYRDIPKKTMSDVKKGKDFFESLIKNAAECTCPSNWSFINSNISLNDIPKNITFNKYLKLLDNKTMNERLDRLILNCK